MATPTSKESVDFITDWLLANLDKPVRLPDLFAPGRVNLCGKQPLFGTFQILPKTGALLFTVKTK